VAVTEEQLAAFVNTTSDDDAAFLSDCLARAHELVTAAIGEATVPDAIVDGASLECAAELYHRRSAPSGIAQQFLGMDGQPNRLARDPMTGARELLKPYLPLGFA